MKRMIVAIVALLGTMSVFAGNGTNSSENNKAQEAFRKDFSDAANVVWAPGKDYLQATFTRNGKTYFAFYSEDGELMSVAHNMLSTQLPAPLFNALKTTYSDYWITELFELNSETGVSYYVTLENAGKRIILQSAGGSDWHLYKKEKKD
jgi:hypothetical protein